MTVAEPTGPLRIITTSVRGHDCPPGREIFADLDAVRRHVRREYRGLSSFTQVKVINAADDLVARGCRSGPGGTGERWTWCDSTGRPIPSPGR